jgi:hypothetical protein
MESMNGPVRLSRFLQRGIVCEGNRYRYIVHGTVSSRAVSPVPTCNRCMYNVSLRMGIASLVNLASLASVWVLYGREYVLSDEFGYGYGEYV